MYQLRTTTKNGEVAIHSDSPALQKTWVVYMSPTEQSFVSATNYTTWDVCVCFLGGSVRKTFTLWKTGMLPFVE